MAQAATAADIEENPENNVASAMKPGFASSALKIGAVAAGACLTTSIDDIVLGKSEALSLAGPENVLLAGAAFSAADAYLGIKDGNFNATKVKNSGLIGLLTTAVSHWSFRLMNEYISNETLLGKIYRAVINIGLYVPFATGVYYTTEHIVEKKPGLYQALKSKFWPAVKETWKWFGIPMLINAYLIPAYLQVPVHIGFSFVYKIIMNSIGKKDKKEQQEKSSNITDINKYRNKFGDNIPAYQNAA